MIRRALVPDAIPLVPFFAVWSAFVGAAVGSFLNVVVARVPAGESIISPRSRCVRCATPIRWYDNLPIVSWFVLRGRCRTCHTRISARYPIVEALGAAIAIIAFARHGLSGVAAAEFAFAATLLALALIDLDTWLLPHAITWPLIGAGLLMAPTGVTLAGGFRPAAYGAAIGFSAFALVAWLGEKALKKEALGFGDVWLLCGIGAWMGTPSLLPIVLLASIQGAVIGVALVVVGKGEPGPPPVETRSAPEPPDTTAPEGEYERSELQHASADDADVWVPPRNAIPFGPFLVAGALEWLWLGDLVARGIPMLRVFR